jgi:hypothetical protein
MLLKKRRVFLKKRHARYSMVNALAAVGAIVLITSLSIIAFRGGPTESPGVALTGQDIVQSAPTPTAPSSATIGTEVESLSLAATGIDITPLLIGGLSMALVGAAMELRAGRRRRPEHSQRLAVVER